MNKKIFVKMRGKNGEKNILYEQDWGIIRNC